LHTEYHSHIELLAPSIAESVLSNSIVSLAILGRLEEHPFLFKGNGFQRY